MPSRSSSSPLARHSRAFHPESRMTDLRSLTRPRVCLTAGAVVLISNLLAGCSKDAPPSSGAQAPGYGSAPAAKPGELVLPPAQRERISITTVQPTHYQPL